MTQDEILFAAFAESVCRVIVANVIEMRAALAVIVQRGLISGSEIETARKQAPPDLVRRLQEEVYTEVMKNTKERYQSLLDDQKGSIQ